MKRTIIVLVSMISLVSCRITKNDTSVLERDLDRIELSIASNTIEKFETMQLEFAMNPEKWATQFIKADYIRTISDSILRVIHNKEILKPEVKSILHKINTEIDFLELQDEHYQLLRDQRFDYWRSNEYLVQQRYAFAIDIRLCLNDVLDELYNQVDLNSYTFNVIAPIVIDSSNVVRVGEMYTAKIGLLAYDSTMIPAVWVDEDQLRVQSGTGIYRAISSSPGIKTITGKIVIERNNCELDTVLYSASYEVK